MRSLFLAFMVLGLLCPGVALAQDDESARAKKFYEKGMARFQLEEYDAAISAWEDGFRLKPVPEFLYNIAQAHRLSNRPEKALGFYKKYMAMAPGAPNHTEVERQIATLQKVVAEQRKASSAPPTEALGPKPGRQPEPEPAPVATPAPEPTPAPAAAPAATVQAEPVRKPTPLVKKPWFWATIGGVVVVGLAVGLGVGLGAHPADPSASFGSVRGN